MKAIMWFLFGMLVAIGGQALAEDIWSYDSQGNWSSGTYDPYTGDYSILGSDGYQGGKAPALRQAPSYRYQSPC